MSSARCRLCEHPLVFAQTKDGRLVTVDERPTPDGTMVLERVAAEIPLAVPYVAHVHGVDLPVRYTVHATTCADATLPQRRSV